MQWARRVCFIYTIKLWLENAFGCEKTMHNPKWRDAIC